MDQRKLIYFLAIAEECSITKAAKRLGLPQPYLSSQLKNMEGELGAKLAQRNTRKLQLTDAGKRFQYRATHILELMDITARELEGYAIGMQGALRIGTIAESAAALLTKPIQLFHQQYPDVRFEIQNTDTKKIADSLKIGIIDLGMVRAPLDPQYYDSCDLTARTMVAAFNTKTYPQNKKIKLTELAHRPLLVHYSFEPVMTEACRAAGFEPDIRCKADDVCAILMWANMGIGTAVIPKDWLGIIPSLQLSYCEIEKPALTADSTVVWLKHHALSLVAQNFLNIIQADRSEEFHFQA